MKKNIFNNTFQCAIDLDTKDELAHFQNEFHFPKINDKKSSLYFCGNSLGLQPKKLKDDLFQELEDWKNYGVEGHLNAKNPWFSYHELLNETSSEIVGAKSKEVVVMNSLTVNLHLLMISFYRPTKKKKKILIESNAFPSDYYAVQSQLRYHNNDPLNDIVILDSNKDKMISTDHIIDTIKKNKDEISLILLGGVNYLTGQLFDLEKIAYFAKEYGCVIGLDLAHATGNVKLKLNKWNIDFAAWCGYKYLNGGPGAPSGVYINSKYLDDKNIKRFEGWWGHDKSNRFSTDSTFKSIKTAEAWQLSNPPIFSMAALLSSLRIFKNADFNKLLNKSKLLTSYLEYLLIENLSNNIKIITPKNQNFRGCQLSIIINDSNKEILNKLYKKSVVCDYRKPNVLRIAPVPLYNSFSDCYNFVKILKNIIN